MIVLGGDEKVVVGKGEEAVGAISLAPVEHNCTCAVHTNF